MTKRNLIDSLLDVLGTRAEAKRAVDFLFSRIIESLKSGENVKISGFGTFYIKISSPRRIKLKGREIDATPKVKIKFKPSRKLSNALKSL
jgi:nucleoid DNA-binding protein